MNLLRKRGLHKIRKEMRKPRKMQCTHCWTEKNRICRDNKPGDTRRVVNPGKEEKDRFHTKYFFPQNQNMENSY